MRYLLKNGMVVSGEKSMKADVLTDGEKILTWMWRGLLQRMILKLVQKRLFLEALPWWWIMRHRIKAAIH